MKIFRILCFSILCIIGRIYLNIKWSAWNPWCVARLNLSLYKYMQTTMYRDRVIELGHNWAFNAYLENNEILFFVKQFTFSDKCNIVFFPFSFGNVYRIPFWRIENWIFGIKEGENE